MKYNIHNILKIESDLNIFPKSFLGEFKNADLIIKKKKVEINKNNCKKFSLKFFGGNNELYFESYFYGYPLNKFLIKNLKEFYYLKHSKRYNIGAIARMLFEINLLKKGYTLVHAGAIERNNRGYLIVAFPEGGKSSTTLSLSLENGKILSDEMIILSEKGIAYSWPTEKIKIYSGSEILKKLNLPLKREFESKFRYIISKIPPLHRVIDANLTLNSGYFQTANRVKINEIITLPKIQKYDKEFLTNRILANTLTLFDYNFPIKVFHAYCYVNGIDPSFFVNEIKAVLSKALDKIK